MFRAARITFFSSKKTNGQMRSGSLGPPSCRTPPVERKSKFSALGKLFKPWKWKRKKKSEKFEQTSRSLERKISVRATREELIQRGVLILDPIIQETETVKELPEKSANGSILTDHSISSKSPALVGLETNSFPSQDYDSFPKVTISSEVVIATEPTPITTIQVEPPENIVTDTQSGLPYISPAASGIVMSEEILRHMEIENNNPFENEPPEMDEPDYDNPTEINCNEGTPEEMFCSVFFDIVQIGLPVPDYDDNDEPGIQIPIIRLPQPNPDIDTTKIEEIPAKDPDLRARPLKSALKKKGEPVTPTSNYPPEIKTLRNDGSLSPSFLQFPMTNMVINNSENKENRPRLPIPVRKIADVNAKDDAPVKFRDENDDEEKNRIAAKIARKNSLALKLSQRPDRQELIDRNIIPSQTETERQETIEAIGNKLSRRLSLRPTQQELEQRNILKQQTAAEEKKEKEEKKIMLLRKLSFRPTIEELKERKIIRFNDYVEVTQVEDYDRKADKPWTRLTPRDKAAIRKELNEFKSTEMEVHEDSRHFTRFHRP